jgi:Fe-S cluster assembly ATP-binding protein
MNSSLTIERLSAGVTGKQILHSVSLTVKSGEIHAIMGPNGGGKSTLAYALMGHPSYALIQQEETTFSIDTVNLLPLSPQERAKAGLFLAFQSPVAIPGVTVTNLLRTAYQEMHKKETEMGNIPVNPVLARRWQVSDGLSLSDFTKQIDEYAKLLSMDKRFFERGIHDGFSGGEKKKLEMLQALVLKPKFAFFDEIDTGLDVDALKTVALGIKTLAEQGTGVVVITHYQRILEYLHPTFVHVFVNGKIVESGTEKLAHRIEKEGYTHYGSHSITD